MRLKLDENLGRQPAELLRGHGHEVATVDEEGLSGAADKDVIRISRDEHRCLLTLDLDFGNPLLFKPSEYSGIAVLRLPRRPSHKDLVQAVRSLIDGLAQRDIDGKLWIVQRGRVREYQQPEIEGGQ
jgi:predicted nuclease of predicted toxin-antitoxin system